jgi:transcriptional regulator with XRE-family HTH domain
MFTSDMIVQRRQEIAKNVRMYRRINDFTQEQTANMLGCSRVRYTNFEKGRAELTTTEIDFLAKQFNVPVGTLFDGQKEKTSM